MQEQMKQAIDELNKNPFLAWLEVAEKFNVPVNELQHEYCADRARKGDIAQQNLKAVVNHG